MTEAPIAAASLTQPLFADLATSTTRLVRCVHPPAIDDLDPGDMVICEDGWGSDEFVTAASAKGIHVRTGFYRLEDERVVSERRRRGVVIDYLSTLDTSRAPIAGGHFDPKVVQASTTAFGLAWDALSTPAGHGTTYEPAIDHVAGAIADHLPYATLNPAQIKAASLMCSEATAMVVAPTGAGKTVIGMMAALHEIKARGRKAAWLVPQRSLTAELDRDLDAWRAQGLKVVALSGESKTDIAAAREADLWVATTEKFEALCRAASMRDAVASVGTLIVDEIHLLGDPGRGPLLETLLARVRRQDAGVRLVGLSATAANAGEVAAWLGARLLTITWRPTRQTHQILSIPNGSRTEESNWRSTAAAAVARQITRDGGSVLVFCGTKANVRSTALAIAASRGVATRGISVNDVEAVHRVTSEAGVGLHYSDWPHKRASEALFRDREHDVLVATSTLAAGVNTPARAVVVRDTSIGPQPMEVSMVQQMFGRAGRAGKEPEGWSFLIATLNETGRWRRRLADGYTITSGILNGVEDHLLGEIVQGAIETRDDAERWWLSTLAHHQGNHEAQPVSKALDFLAVWHLIDAAPNGTVTATRLGALTSKMMVDTRDAADLLASLRKVSSPPRNHIAAEDALLEALSTSVGSLADGPDAPPEHAGRIHEVIRARGDAAKVASPRRAGRSQEKASGAQVSQAGLLLLTRSPGHFAAHKQTVAGVPRTLFNPCVYDTPRYLAWIVAAAEIGALPAWIATVAHDLGHRITWHRLGAPRGAGRLIAACAAAAGSASRAVEVPRLYEAAREAGFRSVEEWRKARSVARPKRVSSFVWDTACGRWIRAQRTAGGSPMVTFLDGDVAGTGWMEKFASTRLG